MKTQHLARIVAMSAELKQGQNLVTMSAEDLDRAVMVMRMTIEAEVPRSEAIGLRQNHVIGIGPLDRLRRNYAALEAFKKQQEEYLIANGWMPVGCDCWSLAALEPERKSYTAITTGHAVNVQLQWDGRSLR